MHTFSLMAVGMLALVIGLCPLNTAQAAVCTWTGNVSNTWDVPGNWSCAGGPLTGDSLVFPEFAANKTMNHNIVNLSVSSIAFTGSSGGYTLAGSGDLTITGSVAITSSANRPSVNTLTLTGAINFGAATATIDTSVLSGQGGELDINGPLNLNGSVLTFVWDSTVPTTNITGAISGSGGLTVNGTGADVGLKLAGNNSFTGPVVVNGGDLELSHPNALGAGGSLANGTTINGGGTLVIGVDIANEHLTLESGAGEGGNGMIQVRDAYVWGGPVVLNGDGASTSFFNLLGTRITFTGPMSGAGGIECCNDALGEVVLSGGGKTFSGPGKFNRGNGGVLHLATSNSLSPNSAILLGGSGGAVLDMATFSGAAASFSGGTGSVLKIAAGQSLTINGGVTLGNTTFNVTVPGSPALGTVFTILNKVAAGGVSGTFAGLPEGASVVAGSVLMRISYVGGTGNDITLTVVGMAPVTVVKGGSGTGGVVSNVGIINCGGTCTDSYPVGTSITLSASASPGSVFTGWLGPCTGTLACTFQLGGATTAQATFALAASGSPTIDIDGSANCLALTDGLLATRHMLGLTGTALINGTIGAGASRFTGPQIDGFLADFRPVLDIDGNGTTDAATDGVLLTRYLFGLRGANLIADAVGVGAIRNTAALIEARIQALCVVTPPNFVLTVPAAATAGTPFQITLAVRDSINQPLTNYRGTVHFTSNDPGATLPLDYTFTAADTLASHTFSVTLTTAGSRSITATDVVIPAATTTQSAAVTAGPATQLVFTQQPANVNVRSTITPSVQVSARDAFGNVVTTISGNVSPALGANPGFATLNGAATMPFVGGLATFAGLSLTNEGTATLVATSTGGLTKTSNPFVVTDNINPGVISDFAAETFLTTENAITLSWTAPGDDGFLGNLAPASGPQGSYRLCHSTVPIVNPAMNCTISTVIGVPVPGSNGMPESITVGALAPNTLYYFALVAIDGAGGKSSALTTASTLPTP